MNKGLIALGAVIVVIIFILGGAFSLYNGLKEAEIGVDAQGLLDGAPATIRIGEAGAPRSPWDGSDDVLSWAGPWAIDEGWWGPGHHRRAYLQVTRRSGPPLLLERSGRWWLDAVYD